MLSDQSKRLIAGILLVLVLGWAVRWWRGRSVVESFTPATLPSLDSSANAPMAGIDQPPE